MERIDPPLHRRAGFEVAGWDGLRWVLEGVFDTSAEAAGAAKQVLARRLGVKITEEAFSDAEGIFKSRILFTEYRDGVTKPERKSAPSPVVAAPPPRPRRKRYLAGTEGVLVAANQGGQRADRLELGVEGERALGAELQTAPAEIETAELERAAVVAPGGERLAMRAARYRALDRDGGGEMLDRVAER